MVRRQRLYHGYEQRIKFRSVLKDSVFSRNYPRLQLLTQMKPINLTYPKTLIGPNLSKSEELKSFTSVTLHSCSCVNTFFFFIRTLSIRTLRLRLTKILGTD